MHFEQCDVALMIDVLQHIVNRDRLTFGLHNVVKSLRQGGGSLWVLFTA